MAYLRLEEAEAVEEAEAESEAALDALADTLRALRAEPPGMAHLLSVCAQQLSAAQRLLRSLETLTPALILARGEAVQQASQQSVARMARVVESARRVGEETLVALGAQRERLGRLRATAGAMQAQMDMAERELRTFVSTALGDNVTLALLVLIALGLVGISVFRVSEIDYSRRSEAADAAASAGHKHIGWQTLSHIVSPLKE
ncbi:hypothetical protein AB1Y20_023453 [Prymnesium parvum]|uniref:Uncharacterized protein n=1 Tax=Prymnesium parvum TaxID=97485 RepID=A0AB34JGQ7_PRYPA